MKNVFLPIFPASCTILRCKTIFHAIGEDVVVEAPCKFMQQLVTLCDGTHTSEEVMQYLNREWDSKTARSLFDVLRRKKVLIDARHISDGGYPFFKTVIL